MVDLLGYNGGMDNLSLFTLLLACATFLLAVAAFWSIWQNYTFRKEEKEIGIKLRNIREIVNWARKARETILNSLTESLTYQKEVQSNLTQQRANLEAQKKIFVSEKRTKANNEEIIKLEKELDILEGQRLSSNDYKVRVMIIIKDIINEFEFIKTISYQFGQGIQPSIQRVNQELVKLIEVLDSDIEKYPDKSLITECFSALNQLVLESNAIEALLIKLGLKLKL
jgi:DNA-binding transcriptional MerR regulator